MVDECVFTVKGQTSNLEFLVPIDTSAILNIPDEGSINPEVSIPTVVDNLASFSDVAGNMEDSGIAKSLLVFKNDFKSGILPYAGGSTTFTLTLAGVTSASSGSVQFATQATPASIRTVQFTTDTIAVIADVNPGVSTVRYLIYK